MIEQTTQKLQTKVFFAVLQNFLISLLFLFAAYFLAASQGYAIEFGYLWGEGVKLGLIILRLIILVCSLLFFIFLNILFVVGNFALIAAQSNDRIAYIDLGQWIDLIEFLFNKITEILGVDPLSPLWRSI